MNYSTMISHETVRAYRAWSESLTKSKDKVYQTKLFLQFARECDKERKSVMDVYQILNK